MATQLQAQLQKLQTRPTHDHKLNKSFLFAAADARQISREEVHQLAIHGLSALVAIDNRFDAFASTLFDVSNVRRERAMYTDADAATLDAQLSKLTALLAPHLLLTAAHQVIEYLIRVFEVHSYNAALMIEMFLPMHDHPLFARILTTLDLRKTGFQFLEKNQEQGAVLPRGLLVTACAENRYVLEMVCRSASRAVEHGVNNNGAFALFVGVVSSLAHNPEAEAAFRVVLPILVDFFALGTEEHRRSSNIGGTSDAQRRHAIGGALIVLCAWAAEVSLGSRTLAAILKALDALLQDIDETVVSVSDALAVLAHLGLTQRAAMQDATMAPTLRHVLDLPWAQYVEHFPAAHDTAAGRRWQPLVGDLVRAALPAAPNQAAPRQFLRTIAENFHHLSFADVEATVTAIVDWCSTEESDATAQVVADFVQILRAVQRHNSGAFDAVLAQILAREDESSASVETFLSRHLSGAKFTLVDVSGAAGVNAARLPLVACLLHATPEVRAMGIKQLRSITLGGEQGGRAPSPKRSASPKKGDAAEAILAAADSGVIDLLCHTVEYETVKNVAEQLVSISLEFIGALAAAPVRDATEHPTASLIAKIGAALAKLVCSSSDFVATFAVEALESLVAKDSTSKVVTASLKFNVAVLVETANRLEESQNKFAAAAKKLNRGKATDATLAALAAGNAHDIAAVGQSAALAELQTPLPAAASSRALLQATVATGMLAVFAAAKADEDIAAVEAAATKLFEITKRSESDAQRSRTDGGNRSANATEAYEAACRNPLVAAIRSACERAMLQLVDDKAIRLSPALAAATRVGCMIGARLPAPTNGAAIKLLWNVASQLAAVRSKTPAAATPESVRVHVALHRAIFEPVEGVTTFAVPKDAPSLKELQALVYVLPLLAPDAVTGQKTLQALRKIAVPAAKPSKPAASSKFAKRKGADSDSDDSDDDKKASSSQPSEAAKTVAEAVTNEGVAVEIRTAVLGALQNSLSGAAATTGESVTALPDAAVTQALAWIDLCSDSCASVAARGLLRGRLCVVSDSKGTLATGTNAVVSSSFMKGALARLEGAATAESPMAADAAEAALAAIEVLSAADPKNAPWSAIATVAFAKKPDSAPAVLALARAALAVGNLPIAGAPTAPLALHTPILNALSALSAARPDYPLRSEAETAVVSALLRLHQRGLGFVATELLPGTSLGAQRLFPAVLASLESATRGSLGPSPTTTGKKRGRENDSGRKSSRKSQQVDESDSGSADVALLLDIVAEVLTTSRHARDGTAAVQFEEPLELTAEQCATLGEVSKAVLEQQVSNAQAFEPVDIDAVVSALSIVTSVYAMAPALISLGDQTLDVIMGVAGEVGVTAVEEVLVSICLSPITPLKSDAVYSAVSVFHVSLEVLGALVSAVTSGAIDAASANVAAGKVLRQGLRLIVSLLANTDASAEGIAVSPLDAVRRSLLVLLELIHSRRSSDHSVTHASAADPALESRGEPLLHIPILALLVKLEGITDDANGSLVGSRLQSKSASEITAETLFAVAGTGRSAGRTLVQTCNGLLSCLVDPEGHFEALSDSLAADNGGDAAAAEDAAALVESFRGIIKTGRVLNRQLPVLTFINGIIKSEVFLTHFVALQHKPESNKKNAAKKENADEEGESNENEDGESHALDAGAIDDAACNALLVSSLNAFAHFHQLRAQTVPTDDLTAVSTPEEEECVVLELLAGNTLGCVLSTINEPTFVTCMKRLLFIEESSEDETGLNRYSAATRATMQGKGAEMLLDRLRRSCPTAEEESAEAAIESAAMERLADESNDVGDINPHRLRRRSRAIRAGGAAALRSLRPRTSRVTSDGLLPVLNRILKTESSRPSGSNARLLQLIMSCIEETIRVVGSRRVTTAAQKVALKKMKALGLISAETEADTSDETAAGMTALHALSMGRRAAIAQLHNAVSLHLRLLGHVLPKVEPTRNASTIGATAALIAGSALTSLASIAAVLGPAFMVDAAGAQQQQRVPHAVAALDVVHRALVTGSVTGSSNPATASLRRCAITSFSMLLPSCWTMVQPMLPPLLRCLAHKSYSVNFDEEEAEDVNEGAAGSGDAARLIQDLPTVAQITAGVFDRIGALIDARALVEGVCSSLVDVDASDAAASPTKKGKNKLSAEEAEAVEQARPNHMRITPRTHSLSVLYGFLTKLLADLTPATLKKHFAGLLTSEGTFWIKSFDILAVGASTQSTTTSDANAVFSCFFQMLVKFKEEDAAGFVSRIAASAFTRRPQDPTLAGPEANGNDDDDDDDLPTKKSRNSTGGSGSRKSGTVANGADRVFVAAEARKWLVTMQFAVFAVERLDQLASFLFPVLTPPLVDILAAYGGGANALNSNKLAEALKSSSRLERALMTQLVVVALRLAELMGSAAGKEAEASIADALPTTSFFAQPDMFTAVMPVVIRHLHNTALLGDQDMVYEDRAEQTLVPAIRAFFKSLLSPKCWSKAQEEILRGLRSPNASVRRITLSTLRGVYADGGDQLAALVLAEALPSVVEATEDLNDDVVEEARLLCNELSAITGQDVLHALSS